MEMRKTISDLTAYDGQVPQNAALPMRVDGLDYQATLDQIFAKLREYWSGLLISTGDGAAYVVDAGIESLPDGFTIAFRPHLTNAANATLDVGTGPKSLRSVEGSNIVAGDLIVGRIYTAVYLQSSNVFVLHAAPFAELARLASPAFTGTPTAPTPATADSTTKLATTAFVKAVDATRFPSGKIATTVLQDRLGEVASQLLDWDTAVANGWYMGSGAANSPAAGWCLGYVESHNSLYVTQTVHQFTADAASDTKMWRRNCDNGVWGEWYRLRISEAELDARYASIAQGAKADAAQPTAQKGIANGYAGLDGAAKVPTSQLPDAVLGALKYQGTWNASTNSPAIPAAGGGNKGFYYLVTTAGSTSVSGITDWNVGDWIVSNGASWDKCDNTDAVSEVAGLTGVISAASLRSALAVAPLASPVFTGNPTAPDQAANSNNGRIANTKYVDAAIASLSGVSIPVGHLSGLTLANNASDATNDIDIAPGSVWAANGSLVLSSALTKRLDAAWAVGSNQGGLDSGSPSNTTYHVYLIKRSDTGVVDALFSTSASSPTMPTNYDMKWRIGSIIRKSNAIVGFIQDGDLFQLKSMVADLGITDPGTSAVLRDLTVPAGIAVEALIAAGSYNANSQVHGFYFSDPATDDIAPSAYQAAQLSYLGGNAGGFSNGASVELRVRTNTSAQIRTRASHSSVAVYFFIHTRGWVDRRGRG